MGGGLSGERGNTDRRGGGEGHTQKLGTGRVGAERETGDRRGRDGGGLGEGGAGR